MLIILSVSCGEDHVPVVTSWVGLSVKDERPVEKIIQTTGKGEASVSWWAGGYLLKDGFYEIELIDLKKRKTVLHKKYLFGDDSSGRMDHPRFNWWHAEQKERVLLVADRKYKMTLRGEHLAQPGAGWGMWLYRIGDEPRRREDPASR